MKKAPKSLVFYLLKKSLVVYSGICVAFGKLLMRGMFKIPTILLVFH